MSSPTRARRLRVRGARGSTPVAAPDKIRYGGHTTCFEVALDPGRHLIIDCGSGVRSLGRELVSPAPGALELHVLFTHYHWDHLEGLPFFGPLYRATTSVAIRGASWAGRGVRQILGGALTPPWFPVAFEDTSSAKTYQELLPSRFGIAELQITAARLHHPQGSFGFRLERDGHSVVVATDHEPGDAEADRRLLDLASGADVLLVDAQYTPEEYAAGKQGWGHGHWRSAVELALAASAARLVLCHHDPDRTDDALERIVDAARAVFPATEAAREGLELPL